MVTRSTKLFLFTGTCIATYPLFNFFLQPQFTKVKKVENTTAIVTGATGNLGTAITYHLASKNVRVIMACRNMENCKLLRRQIVMATGHKGIACRHLDLEDIDSINRFADEIIKTEPHIDILINNAAVKIVEKREMTKYGIEKNYFVNFLAPFLLTLRLIDKLKESSSITRDSRIINVIGTPKRSWDVDLNDINFDKRNYDPKKAYTQSKLALAYFTILLDKFNREKKNCIYVFGTSPCSKYIAKSLYRPIGDLDNFKYVINSYYSYSPDRAISSVIRCALDTDLTDIGRSGQLYTYFLSSWGWGVAGKDENKAKMVWNSAVKSLLDIPSHLNKVKPEEESRASIKESEVLKSNSIERKHFEDKTKDLK